LRWRAVERKFHLTCQVIEDAVVLAQLLGQCARLPTLKADVLSATLSQYQARRLARANRLVNLSHRMGRVGQWANPVVCGLRNAGIKLLGALSSSSAFDDLYGFTP
jgi:2-polyprenyl-6-methoxyphenol hydroxylase-like FAD-dependent oxidoreductase